MEKKTTKQEKPQKTEADKIWEAIESMTMDIFALPNQKVHDYFTPVPIEPTKLYLRYKVSAALPALEESLLKRYSDGILQTKFVVSTTDKYVVVDVGE